MKQKLQSLLASAAAVINTDGGVRADGQPASARSVEYGHALLANSCRRWYQLGFDIESVHQLEALHIDALVKNWHLDGLSAKTMETQLSKLRIFCGWMGKPEIVRKGGLPTYLPDVDPKLLKVKPKAHAIKVWAEDAVRIMQAADSARTDEPRFHWILLMGVFFGLSRREIMAFDPHKADKGTYLEIPRPDGGVRWIPIFSNLLLGHVQRLVLNEIKSRCKPGGVLAWPNRSVKQSISRLYYLMRRMDVTLNQNGITPNNLSEAFKQNEALIIDLLPSAWRASLPASFFQPLGTRIGNLVIDEAGDTVGALYVWPAAAVTAQGEFVPLSQVQSVQARVTVVIEKIGIKNAAVDLARFLERYPQLCAKADVLLARVALTRR